MIQCSRAFLTNHEKYREPPQFSVGIRLYHFRSVSISNMIKPGFGENPTQSRPIESKMKHARIIGVKLPIIKVQVSNAQITPRDRDSMELSEEGFYVLYVVKGHAA